MPTEAGVVELGVVPELSQFATLLSSGVLKALGPVGQLIKDNLGKALGVAAAAAAFKLGEAAVSAFTTHQTTLVALENTMKNVPALANANVQAFDAQAVAIEHTTGYMRDQILAADEIIARFDLNQHQIQQAIPLVVDYAAKTKQSVETSALLVGRALVGNARALKSIGIEYKATGDRAADFATIYKDLQSKVGGVAEALGKTLPGQINILKGRMNDLLIQLGRVLVPVLLDIVHVANNLLIPVFNAIANHATIITKVIAAFLGFEAVKGVFKLFGLAISFVKTELIAAKDAAIGYAVSLKALAIATYTNIASFIRLNLQLADVIIEEGLAEAATIDLGEAMGIAALGPVAVAVGLGVLLGEIIKMIPGVHQLDEALSRLFSPDDPSLQPAAIDKVASSYQGVVQKWKDGELTATQFRVAIGLLNESTGESISANGLMQLSQEKVVQTTKQVTTGIEFATAAIQRYAKLSGQSVADLTAQIQSDISSIAQKITADTKSGLTYMEAKTKEVNAWYQNMLLKAKDYIAQWRASTTTSLDFMPNEISGLATLALTRLKTSGAAMQAFAKETGQTGAAVVTTVKSATDALTTAVEQARASGQSANLAAVQATNQFMQTQLAAARSYFSQWRTTTADSLNFVQSGLLGIIDNVDFADLTIHKILDAEHDSLEEQQKFTGALNKILDAQGSKAKAFVQWAIQQGPAAFALVDKLAGSTSGQMANFINTWNKANKGAASQADILQKRLLGTMKQVRNTLEDIVKNWKAPALDVEKLIKLQQTSLREQEKFNQELIDITDKYGPKAKAFVGWAIQQGPAAFSLVDGLAKSGAKHMSTFLGDWNTANKNAESTADTLSKRILGTLKEMENTLKRIASKVWGITIDAQFATARVVGTAGASLGGAIDAAGNKIAGRVGHHAAGGWVNRPELSWVAEREPELIIPKSKLAGLGGDHHVHVTVAVDPQSGALYVKNQQMSERRYGEQRGRMNRG